VSARAWATFAAVSVLWGIPYLFIKIAVDDGLSPFFVAWARVVLGAVVLVAFARHAGVLGALRGHWRWLAAFAVVEIALPFPLIAEGERHVSSSLAAILIAAAPLFVALLALRFDRAERAGGLRLVGLVVGLAGVVALMGIDVAGRPDELAGAAAILVAALGYAIGPMILKHRLAGLDPRAVMGAALTLAAVPLTPAAALTWPDAMPSAEALVALAVLGLLCSALALVLMAELVADIGPGRALVVTYINPVVAVVLGIVVLGESLGPGAFAGLTLILLGSWLSTDGRLPPGLARRLPRRVGAAGAE
jgi:drug/metabolite transporter (DMT)-like permease